MYLNKVLLCILLMLIIGSSCDNPKVPHVSHRMEKRIDTLFRNAKDSLQQLAIENCTRKHDDFYDNAVDSIYEQRILEIKSLSN